VHMPLCLYCHVHKLLVVSLHVNMTYSMCFFNMPFLVRVMGTCRYVHIVILTCL
jgi:hypothetical protein